MKIADYITPNEFREYADIGITPEDSPQELFTKLSRALNSEKIATKPPKGCVHLFEPWSFTRLRKFRSDLFSRGLRWTKYPVEQGLTNES